MKSRRPGASVAQAAQLPDCGLVSKLEPVEAGLGPGRSKDVVDLNGNLG